MLIHTRRPNEIEVIEPRIVCLEDPSYEIPLAIVDPHGITENDQEMINGCAMYAPKTRLKRGDLVMLKEVPFQLRRRGARLPRVWKIRYVATAWAYELISQNWQHGGNLGFDRACAQIDRSGFTPADYRKPVIYAHGYPHGFWPGSATWLPERVLMKAPFREDNATWRDIVNSAGADFYGYDAEKIPSSFAFAFAPDDYSNGQNIGKPFDHEENVTHAMCLSGLEETMFLPINVAKNKGAIDPETKERLEDHTSKP